MVKRELKSFWKRIKTIVEMLNKGESGRERATDCDPATRDPEEGEGAEQ